MAAEPAALYMGMPMDARIRVLWMPVTSAASGVFSAARAGRHERVPGFSCPANRQTVICERQIFMRQQTAKNCKASLLTVVVLAIPLPVAASEYLPLRFEEDWGASCNKITPKCWRIGATATAGISYGNITKKMRFTRHPRPWWQYLKPSEPAGISATRSGWKAVIVSILSGKFAPPRSISAQGKP